MKENYFTYLSNLGFIGADSDVRLKDEPIIEKLRELKLRYIVEEPDRAETQNFLKTWPKTAAYIRAAHSPVARFEGFRILRLKRGGSLRDERRWIRAEPRHSVAISAHSDEGLISEMDEFCARDNARAQAKLWAPI